MLLLYTAIKQKLRSRLVFILAALFSTSGVNANTLESLVMPGEVISAHKKVETECKSCHELFSSQSQNKLCIKCHEDTGKDINTRKGYHGKNKSVRNAECKSCHTEHKGRDADVIKLDVLTFNHNQTDFKLKGKHQVTQCTECHKEGEPYRKASSSCKSCHDDNNPHKKAKAKKEIFNRCTNCHSEQGWERIKFEHFKVTEYRLKDSHALALCQSCHIKEVYKDTPKQCYSCHKADDVHAGKNGNKCDKCHNTKQWKKISFNHDRDTSFKLRFKHKKTRCSSCHKEVKISKSGTKKKKARKCVACHSYDDTHGGRFGNKCSDCHSDKKWNETKFNHNKDTKFRIKGKHKDLSCNQCHSTAKKKLKTACVSCHKADDRHKGSLGKKCQSCHTESGWDRKVKFDHDLTSFPLIGMHGAVNCYECHSSTSYQSIKKDCITCHKKNDNHKGKMGNQCERCHTPNDWGVWIFDHNKQSKFKLRHAHARVHCHTCHSRRTEKIQRRPRDCRSCHSGDDIHNGQFGAQCNDCHTTKNFLDIRMK